MTDKELETIKVKLTAADYASFNVYHGRWQLFGLFLFYSCLFTIFFTYGDFLGENTSLAAALPLSVVMGGLLLIYQLWRIRARTAKLFENDKMARLEQQVRLSENGMQHVTGDNAVYFPWSDIYKAAETKQAIIIYLTRNKVVLLPKRDISDMEAVKDMLRKHLPAAKLRLKAKKH